MEPCVYEVVLEESSCFWNQLINYNYCGEKQDVTATSDSQIVLGEMVILNKRFIEDDVL